MRALNTKQSVVEIFGRAFASIDCLDRFPTPEFQFRNDHKEFVFKWKTTPGVTAWWFVITELDGGRYSSIAANQDRCSGETLVAQDRDFLEWDIAELMEKIIDHEEQELQRKGK